MLPKAHLENIKLRHKAIGKERRRNMVKLMLDHAPTFPLAVELTDIDKEVERWVQEDLDISFDGKRLPTFKLFSNQRINEYAQTWNHLDETGNLLMNFKTITRENNPKKGENQGDSYNIPGDRYYPMFIVPVLQENGLQGYDMYSMKQPYSVDLDYSLTVITNKYELLNEMNMLMNDKFKAIDCYIFPNQHPMPLTLEDIADESEYSLDDRKYYSQTYKLKLKAYIIREEDYKVTKLESRVPIRLLGDRTKKKPYVEVEEEYSDAYLCMLEEKNRYYPKAVTLNINMTNCEKVIDFTMDCDLTLEEVEMSNVYDIVVTVNGEFFELEDLTEIFNGDNVHIEIEMEDDFTDALIVFKGVNKSELFDSEYDPEVSLDEPFDEEIIDINEK